MNRLGFLAVLSLLLGAGCQPAESSLTLKNSSDLDRSHAPVRISMAELTQKGMQEVVLWAPYDAQGEVIPYQYDDLDQDGEPDELFFLVDIAAGAAQTVTFQPALNEPNFSPLTHLRLGQKGEDGITPLNAAKRLNTEVHEETEANFQFEGVGWENEQVAFRNYMDLRNGMDIFGKTVPQLYLDSVGVDGDDSYHEISDWGMDILKVGSSLGAGSVAFWYQDSLIRLTSTDADYRTLVDGPLRSVFALTFRGVDLGDKQIDVTHTISILPGKYYYQSTLELSDSTGVAVVVGLVDLHALEDQTLEANAARTLYTYGAQSENADSLGMALMIAKDAYQGMVDTDSISTLIPNTYAFLLAPDKASYRFYAGWELSDARFEQEASFEAYLKEEMVEMSSPLTITWH